MKKYKIALVLLLVFLCGCSSEVVQTNDSFTAKLLMHSTFDWYVGTAERFQNENENVNIDIDYFNADAFDLLNRRDNKEVNTSELQGYYDETTNALRTNTAGDLVVGDALYLDWPEVTPIDWQKLMRSGAFSAIESDDAVLEYAKINSSASAYKTDDQWILVPLTYKSLIFYTSKGLAEKWNFDFPDIEGDYDGDHTKADTILEFLEKCAVWVEKYGDVEGAPSIMPDYEFRRLKGVAFDVCGIEIVDYKNGTVNFDNETVRRLLQALKTIESDIEDSGIGDQMELFFAQEAAQAQRYLICQGYLYEDDYLSMSPLDANREYLCYYATRWAAIPATSSNKEIATRYLESLLRDEKAFSVNASVYQMFNQTPNPTEKAMDIVIPSTWQYALSDLFDEFYMGRMDIDEFTKQVQQRLEVYVTE